MDVVINGELSEEYSEQNSKSKCDSKDEQESFKDPSNSNVLSSANDSANYETVSSSYETIEEAHISAQENVEVDSVTSNCTKSDTANPNNVVEPSKNVYAESELKSDNNVTNEVHNCLEQNDIPNFNTSSSPVKKSESNIENITNLESSFSYSQPNSNEDPISDKVDHCHESSYSGEHLDPSACEVLDYSSKIINKDDKESSSEIYLSSIKSLEQRSENGSHFISSDVTKSVISSDVNKSDSQLSNNINFTEICNISNKNNDSNPLEQLSQHLKSIGNDDMYNYDFPKTTALNEVNGSSEKTESSKLKDERQKDCGSFIFTEISKTETGFPDIFTGLVTIGKYISVKGDFTLRSSEALVESPSLIAPYLLKEPDSFPVKTTPAKSDQRGFFHSTAGEFLIGIGLSRVNEWYHRDMMRIKKRQIKREGKSPQLEEDLKLYETCFNEARKANRTYSFPLKSCNTCGFVTESSIVMEGHLLVPHITPRREYQCNFCEAINRDPKGMLEHMYRAHGKTGRIQPPVCFFECPYCTFESNSKVKLGNHLTKCQRFYDPNRNQTPPKDFEFPALTPKPITVAVVKAYEKSLSSMQRGRGRPRKTDNLNEHVNLLSAMHSSMVPNIVHPTYRPGSTSGLSDSLSNLPNPNIPPIHLPNMNLRHPHSSLGQIRPSIPPMHLSQANRFYQVVNSSSQIMPMLGNSSFVTSPSQFPFSPNLVNSSSKKAPGSTTNFLNSFLGSGLRHQNPSKNVPEVTITPLPKLQGPYPVPQVKSTIPPNNSVMQGNSLVVCEICDGYIKDLEQLRSHMQLIHKVKIHPKMLVSRPPLNCQKCQWRFFTDQGLERHLLGSHGLVTSNMQELANKGKDAGCCTICGRVYASKLVSHMNQVHKLTLKPAHLSYKCTVCSATFNLYRLFENHVYLVHSGAAKRSADGSSNLSKKFKSDNNEFLLEESSNLIEKRTIGENLGKCNDCGQNFIKIAQTEKCEKCLKYNSDGSLNSQMS